MCVWGGGGGGMIQLSAFKFVVLPYIFLGMVGHFILLILFGKCFTRHHAAFIVEIVY